VTGTPPRIPARRVLPPSRDRDGNPSAAWLLVQAAQLAIETSWVLHAVNGTSMNLAEERRAQSEAAALLENAARAAVIMESGMPLAAAWAEGLPRARAIFARAREADSDVASVTPDFVLPPRSPVPPEILSELERASWEDPDPLPKCVGVTKRGVRCERDVFKGIGSAHCHDHFTAEERRRHDLLEAARARVRDAEEQVVLDQRRLQAEWWVDRYSQLRSRLEVPSQPALIGEADPDCPEIPSSAEFRRMAMRYLYATGWPDITPRAAEVIRALADLGCASPQVIAEHALGYAPGRWATAEEWLGSSIWDGYQPPLEHLPPAGTVPDFDEYPGVRELRCRMELEATRLLRWKDGFEALVAACACKPVATMSELLTFWLDIDVLEEACDADAGGTRLCIEISPTSPWIAVRLRSQGRDGQVLDHAFQFLVRSGVPWDPDTMHVAPGDPDVPPR
jgi:hypothetical protein